MAKSHPTRVRGLKLGYPHHPHRARQVAPHAGAWIETPCWREAARKAVGRTPRGCVD